MSEFAHKWLAIVGLSLVVSTSVAAPQAQPGDVGLRHDIQVLADYGAITGPVTTWPISWDAVLADLEYVKATDVVLPNRVLPTFERVLARARREAGRGQVSIGGSLGGAEKPTQIRGFSDTPREEWEAKAGVSWFSEHVSLDLNVSGVDAPTNRLPDPPGSPQPSNDDDDVRADGSQVAVDVGNWSIGASTYDRWWGPGWDGSLILSNNARPIPSLVIGRNRTQAFETRLLSWLGPWDLQVMFGQLEEERAIPDAQFFGMRVNFRPLNGLEIGISRTAQWCGDGRPCDFDTFWDLFWGKDNIGDDETTFENEPGNQMAGFDVRWTNMWTGTPLSIYAQAIGEDEAGGFPSRYLAQVGIEGSGITRDQTSYRWFVEVAGTSCDFIKDDRFNCAYRQAIYESGYTYYGRIIGHGLDNDARIGSIGAVVVSPAGNSWQVVGRYGDLNRGGSPDPDHSVAVDPQELASIDIQHTRDTKFGRFDIGIGFERREFEATGDNERDTRGFLRWTSPPWGR